MGQGQLPNLLTDVSTIIYLCVVEQKTYPLTEKIDLSYLFQMKITSIYSGPPQSFCFLRDNGQYTNPDNEQQFFTCTDNIGSACQMCPGNLVFKAKCGQCLEVNIDCAMTTAKPTAKNPTAATNKATVTTANGSGTTTKPSTRCMYSSTYLYSNTKFVSVNANN